MTFFTKFMTGLDPYKDKKHSIIQEKMKKGAWNQLIVLGFLYNSDRERYRKLLKDYQTDFADNTDNFLKDLVSMHERMSLACNEDRFMRKKNKEKEEKLSDYYDKMKAFSVQVKKYLPDDVLHQFMKGLDSYKDVKDSIAQEKMRKGAWNQLISLGF